MRVSVIGTGYVGLVSGTCFAEMGHSVDCIDIDISKIDLLKSGGCPIYEPGLTEMIERNVSDKRLSFSTTFDSVKDSDAVFLAVGTPMSEDGQADLKYLYSAAESIASFVPKNGIIVIKSTVPVGTAAKLNEFLSSKINHEYHIVNNPEFLKEGAAIDDFMRPERIVIGSADDYSFNKISDLYDSFFRESRRIIRMTNVSAEMTKYAANCFLATKISFINEIARLCDLSGADVEEVRTGIQTDSRIGHKFLYPGPGYGGSCFPKDVRALAFTAKQLGYEFKIVEATEKVNQEQKLYMLKKIKKHFGSLSGKTFTFWGVAFKAKTDDIRETPAIYLAQALNKEGAKVKYYDPIASNNFKKFCEEKNINAEMSDDMYEACSESDGLIILTEWKQLRNPDFLKIKNELRENVIFDARNLYSFSKVSEAGMTYYSVGKKES